jgi:hypothetical protein
MTSRTLLLLLIAGFVAGCTEKEAVRPPVDPGYIEMRTPDFSVPQGEEVQHNYFMKFPSDVPVLVNRVHLFMNEGSHHFNIYKSPPDGEQHPDGTLEVGFDTRFFEPPWQLVIDNQAGDIDWTLPAGVAFRLEPREQLNLQLHYTNTATQPTPGVARGTVRWYKAPPGSVEYEAGAIFAWNPNVLLPPHTEASFSKRCVMPQDIWLMALTGHFHSRGKKFRVWKTNTEGEREDLIFESRSWDEPPFAAYDPPVLILEGEGLIYTCDYVNDTDMTIRFGGHNIVEEHSNVFAFFYPNRNGNINFIGADSVEVGVVAGGRP